MYREPVVDHKLYKLLDLIDKEDSLALLSEEKLTDSFNMLLRNDLISITDGKVQLTEKGLIARNNREKFLLEPEPEDETIYFSKSSLNKSRRLFYISLYVLLLCLVGLSVVLVLV